MNVGGVCHIVYRIDAKQWCFCIYMLCYRVSKVLYSIYHCIQCLGRKCTLYPRYWDVLVSLDSASSQYRSILMINVVQQKCTRYWYVCRERRYHYTMCIAVNNFATHAGLARRVTRFLRIESRGNHPLLLPQFRGRRKSVRE